METKVTLITSGSDKFSYGESNAVVVSDGLLRDLFAAFALAGNVMSWGVRPDDECATRAYQIADALLAARKAEKE